MKRLLLLLSALLCTFGAFADEVGKDRAADVAAAFFGTDRTQVRTVARAAAQLEAAAAGRAEAFHVFNREGGGFVVIAGVDCVEPVLAWSDSGRFPEGDDMPANMAWWFSRIAGQIRLLPPDREATAEIRLRWAAPSVRPEAEDSMLLPTAEWGQRAPYNNDCPLIGNTRALTGCVATAGAILARYFEWPDRGVGTIPAYGLFGAHELGHEYNYQDMPLSYSDGYTAAQADAVAALMYDMGTMSRMDYGLSGSGALTLDLLVGFKTYMKYDRGASIASRDNFSDEAWIRLMKDNLRDCGPTIYGGYDPAQGGHQFILDGYNGDDWFHFNWGWDGRFNCYCYVTGLITEDGDDFTSLQDAILGLVPDRDGTSSDRDDLHFYFYDAHGWNAFAGLSVSTGEVSPGTPFQCNAGSIYNPQTSAFNGRLYVSLYDKEGVWKEDVSNPLALQLESGYLTRYENISCIITGGISPGDRLKMRFEGHNNSGTVSAEQGCTDEIVIMPEDAESDNPEPDDPADAYTAEQTAANTSLSYDKATSTLRLDFGQPSFWSMSDPEGEPAEEGRADGGDSVFIDLSEYPRGTYTFRLGSRNTPFVFTLTR